MDLESDLEVCGWCSIYGVGLCAVLAKEKRMLTTGRADQRLEEASTLYVGRVELLSPHAGEATTRLKITTARHEWN